jgi:hypothetical protein
MAYRRDIVAVLLLKAVGLALLYILFFAPSRRPDIPEPLVARHLLATAGPNIGNEAKHDR